MKAAIKILSTFLLTLTFLLLPVSSGAANTYVVQPFILIPKDWKDRETPTDIESYKQVIINDLRRVQQFYASKLNGKSFNFNTTVKVVYSDKEIKDINGKEPFSVFNDLNSNKFLNSFGDNLIPLEAGQINANWIIGLNTLSGAYAQGGPRGPNAGILFMPYVDLFNARGDLGFTAQQFSKMALAHELGHAFGLDFAGYAKGHPCTEVSTKECVDGTPQPYPPAQEWTSVMGYNNPFENFPNIEFNNSLANPEIKTLYQSPFLNPNHDPAPEPTVDAGVKVPFIFRFGSEQTIGAGKTFNIPNNGNELFGEIPGKIEFISTLDKITTLPQDVYEVRKWDSRGIEIFVKEDAVSAVVQSRWKLRITTANNKIWQSDEDVIIQGKDFAQLSLILTANLSTTCGGENKPVSAQVGFTGTSASGDIGTSAITDSSTGKGEISLQINGPQAGSNYTLIPLSLEGIPPVSKEEILTLEAADIHAGKKIVDLNIHYPSCPGGQPAVSPTPQVSTAPTGTKLTLTVNLQATCGEEKKPLATEFHLFGGPPGAQDRMSGASVFTDQLTGKGEISLDINNPVVGAQYQLDALLASGVGQLIKTYTLDTQDIQAGKKTDDVTFFDPVCPASTAGPSVSSPFPSASVIPSPSATSRPTPTFLPLSTCPQTTDNCVYSEGNKCYSGHTSDTTTCTWINGTCLNPTAGCNYSCGPVNCPSGTAPSSLPTPTSVETSSPTPSQTPAPTEVLISNYMDFRNDNVPGDEGSTTMTINNPSGQTVIWKLSTLIPSPKKRVFIRTITGEKYKDYEPLNMGDGEIVSIAGVNIQAKVVKKVTKVTITVNGQDQEIDLNNPQEIAINLPGTEGRAQQFSIPYIIEYSNGEVIHSALEINYQPRVANPTAVPTPLPIGTPTPPSATCSNGTKRVGETWPECHGCDEGTVTCIGQDQYSDFNVVRSNSPNCGAGCGQTAPPPPATCSNGTKRVGEKWGECHGCDEREITCIGQDQYDSRSVRNPSPVCGSGCVESAPPPSLVTCSNGLHKLGETWPECHGCDEGTVTCIGQDQYSDFNVANPNSSNCGPGCGQL